MTRSLTWNRAYGLTVVIVLSMAPLAPVAAPVSSNAPSPSLRLTATPASSRPQSASVPSVPVTTSPPIARRPVSDACSPSKRPCATRPQAARPGPAPSPARRKWNALPSSNSRPVADCPGGGATARGDDEGPAAAEPGPPPGPGHPNGSPSVDAGPPAAPKRCASPVSTSVSALAVAAA